MPTTTASPAQIAANRLNAQKSTGPRTEQGKNRSRNNAYRHGLTAQVTIMTDPDRDAQEKFLAACIANLNPDGFLQQQLAQSLAHDQWRMNRIRAIEENALADGLQGAPGNTLCTHPEIHSAIAQCRTFFYDSESFLRLSLYEQRLHRNFHRNLKLYKELVKESLDSRAAETTQAVAEPLTMTAGANALAPAIPAAEAPPPAEANSQPPAASTTSKEIGFVHPNWNIAPPAQLPPDEETVTETPFEPEILPEAA